MRRWPGVLLAVCSIVAGTVTVLATPAGAAPAWSITASPNPPSPVTGAFSDVSCTTATSCFAVGSKGGLPLIERWNGTIWTGIKSPSPPAASSSQLNDVSCTSPTSCFAVGTANVGSTTSTLVERWNGMAWAIGASVNGPSGSSADLQSVSCTSTTNCFAVGSLTTGSASETLVEQWNGTMWAIVASPSPSSGTFASNGLNGVSCTSTTSCFAVGSYFVDNGLDSATHTLAIQWDGTAWSQDAGPDQFPNPAGLPVNVFTDVSCTTAVNCTAVGYHDQTTGASLDTVVEQTLVAFWNGTDWELSDSPNAPVHANSALQGVSCTGITSCTAVGSTFETDGSAEATVTERFTGSSWVLDPSPNGAGATRSRLSGVWCGSSTSCIAVGSSSGASSRTLVEAWNGAAWAVVASPNAAGPTNAELGGVACTTVTNCFAVGDGGGKPLVERWNGTAWAIVARPLPSGASGGRLDGVACPGAASCFAVGSYFAAGSTRTLVERWNGSQWMVVASPNPSGAGVSTLSSVACPSTASCFAVGAVTTGSNPKTLIERWNGSAWSVVASPTPGFTGSLASLACTTATSCLAVGSYESGATTFTLSERWNGTGWAVVASPNRAGASVSRLSGISCVTAANCYAAGAGTVSGVTASFVLHWNGSSWVGTQSAHPAGSTTSDLAGISCSSATSCVAVGDYVSAGVTKTFAQIFDGTSWSVSVTPNPSGAQRALFGAVVCRTGPVCLGVGHSESGAQRLTLTERYA